MGATLIGATRSAAIAVSRRKALNSSTWERPAVSKALATEPALWSAASAWRGVVPSFSYHPPTPDLKKSMLYASQAVSSVKASPVPSGIGRQRPAKQNQSSPALVNFHFDLGGFAPANSKKCDAGMRQRPFGNRRPSEREID